MKKSFITFITCVSFIGAGFAQNNVDSSRRDTGLSHMQAPPDLPYIQNNPSTPQYNAHFNISGTGSIWGSDSYIPFFVNSFNQTHTAMQLSNNGSPGPGGSWLLDVNNNSYPGPGAFSLINGRTSKTAIKASENGYVSINTLYPATSALDVNGDINASGSFLLGIQYLKKEFSMDHGYKAFTLDCPAGYQAISGGGGGRDLNSTIKDIQVAFSGPDEDAPATRWRLYLYNSSKSSRAVVINCTCAKVK